MVRLEEESQQEAKVGRHVRVATIHSSWLTHSD